MGLPDFFMSDKLNLRQIRFCQEYILDLNGEKAAIRAGYSETSARTTASELLTYPNVQAYVQELLDDRATRTQATADKVISEIFHLVSFDTAEIYDEQGRFKNIHSIPKNIRKAIASIETVEEFERSPDGSPKVKCGYIRKIKFWDKNKAIELLGKHLVLFTEKHEFTGANGAPLLNPLAQLKDDELDAIALGITNRIKSAG